MPPSNSVHTASESASEIAGRAYKIESDEWIPFDNHFFHGCCECGLSHRVDIRVRADGFEMQWLNLPDLTEESRKQHDHPLFRQVERLRKALQSIATNTLVSSTADSPEYQRGVRVGLRIAADMARRALATNSPQREHQSPQGSDQAKAPTAPAALCDMSETERVVP